MSLKAENEGRLHIHAYWHSSSNQTENRVFAGTQKGWAFEGSLPILRTNVAKGKNVQRATNRGHYYCQCNKIGAVESFTNYHKYTDFVVEQKWVIELWQRRKLDHKRARAEIIAARGHTMSYLKEIDAVEELEERAAIENEKKMIDLMVNGHMKPFKWIPEVSLWKLQYARNHVMGLWGKTNRFKYLVLTGPSSLGKTAFAKSLFGIDSTFVVPCQGVEKPDLQEFKRYEHPCIIFDEVTSHLIASNKAVFQANTDVVLLGQSPTGNFVYRRFLYGTAMICCTNTWMEGVERGSRDEEWLLTNSIVVDCTERLWID